MVFQVKRPKQRESNPYAVEHEEEKKDFMEIENEKLDKQMEESLKDTGEEDGI
jgi:hypothetical protein